MKTFACKDIGMDCDWSCEAKDEQEILKQVRQHAATQHSKPELDEDLVRKIRGRIKDKKSVA